jgi:hypothetical protein
MNGVCFSKVSGAGQVDYNNMVILLKLEPLNVFIKEI